MGAVINLRVHLVWLILECIPFIPNSLCLQDSFDAHAPSIVESKKYNLTAGARKLRHAMEGYGTNEDDITSVLATSTYDQRKTMEDLYKKHFKRSLMPDFDAELSGSYKILVKALMQKPEDVLADSLFLAMDGWGTDEETLTEILCCRSSQDIKEIADAFYRIHRKNLEQMVHSETSGNYRKLLHAVLTRPRKGGSDAASKEIAQGLIRAGFGRSGKLNEDDLINQLTLYSFPQIRNALRKFEEMVGSALQDYIKRSYTGDFRVALLKIVTCADNRPKAYAQRLHDAFGKLRTNDKLLVRIIALRSTIDMKAISNEYQQLYKEPLENSITKGTKGDLRYGLLTLISGQARAPTH